MATEERVVQMANQIARNIAVQGGADPAEATAAHIRAFWDRRMKGLLTAHYEAGSADLSLLAREAAAILAQDKAAAGTTTARAVLGQMESSDREETSPHQRDRLSCLRPDGRKIL